jgi:hypothetical protein
MAEKIFIKTKNADGHEIDGTYWPQGDIIMVTLSGGGSVRVQRDSTPIEDQAKRLLLGLDRKSRGIS